MKQSFLNKFTKSPGSAPIGWPAEDSNAIDASAAEIKKITADLIKKILICIPTNALIPQSSSIDSNFLNTSPSPLVINNQFLGAISPKNNLNHSTHNLIKSSNLNSSKNEVSLINKESQKRIVTKNEDNHNTLVDSCHNGIPSHANISKQAIHFEGDCDYLTNQMHQKKIPESLLARSCLESSEKLTNLQPTLSHMLFGCGQAASQLACARVNWGSRVHESVISPLRRIGEATAANGELIKSRRQAWRVGGELRSVSERAARAVNASSANAVSNDVNGDDQPNASKAEMRYQPLLPDCISVVGRRNPGDRDGSLPTAMKSPSTPLKISAQPKMCLGTISPRVTPSPSSTNSEDDRASSQKNVVRTAKATQLNAIKEELEMESEIIKEKALHELYNFESMSTLECGRALVDLVEISATYHRVCASILDEITPLLKGELDDQCPLPVFGRSLEVHLRSTGHRIAYPLRMCIQALSNPSCLSEEGLFRCAGSKKKVDTLKSALNTMRAERIIEQYDPFVIADALKQYLRSLPEPLLKRELFDEWADASRQTDTNSQIAFLQQTAGKMSDAFRTNAGYLFRFLNRVTTFADKNRMTSINLGIVFGPTLLAPDSNPTSLDFEPDDGGGFCKRNNSISQEVIRQNGISNSMAYSGIRGSVIEKLITHAHVIFTSQDKDECKFEFPLQTSIQTSDGLESALAVWTGESEEMRNGDDRSKECTPKLISSPSNDLGKKASRAMSEFARQSRVIRSIPQRLKVKHPAAWQTMFSRPQSSPSEVKVVPTSVRSLTPVSVQRQPKDVEMRGSLPDTNKIVREASDVEDEFFPLNAQKSPEAWSDSVESQSLLLNVDDAPKIFHPTSPPRSDLQLQHQEWRRAMLEVSLTKEEDKETEPKFLHGDLYDTLFTLQTLNSVGGLEDFLTRVRSVYENRTSILKFTKSAPVKTTVITKSPKKITYSARRHSTSSLAVTELNESTALPRPVSTTAARHYKKCLTSPGPINLRSVVPVSPPPATQTKPTRSTIARSRQSDFNRVSTGMTNLRNLPQQANKKARSSCAARLGEKLSIGSPEIEPDSPRMGQRSSTPFDISNSLKSRTTLPRATINGNATKAANSLRLPLFEQTKLKETLGTSLPSLPVERVAFRHESLPPT